MASGLSRVAEKEVLEGLFKNKALTARPEFWLALCVEAPTTASTGITIVETEYVGYERKLVKAAEMAAAVEGAPSSIANSGTITFAGCTGEGVKKGVKWIAACTTAWKLGEAKTGAVIAWGEIEAEIVVTTVNTPVVFAAEQLKFTAS